MHYLRNKKAQGTGYVAAAVLMLMAIFLILVLVGGRFIPWLYRGSEEEICQQSIVARANTIKSVMGKPLDLGFVKELKCKTQYVYIREDGIYKQDKLLYGINADDKSWDDFIKKTVADEMVSCWRMMGKGELEIWAETEQKVHCLICSEITFKMKNPPDKITDFDQYLKNTPIRSSSKDTYADYFKFSLDKTSEFNINVGVPLDIVYVQTTRSGAAGFLKECAIGATTAGLVSLIPVVNLATPIAVGIGCGVGIISTQIKSKISEDENTQGVLLVLPATTFDSSKCDATY